METMGKYQICGFHCSGLHVGFSLVQKLKDVFYVELDYLNSMMCSLNIIILQRFLQPLSVYPQHSSGLPHSEIYVVSQISGFYCSKLNFRLSLFQKLYCIVCTRFTLFNLYFLSNHDLLSQHKFRSAFLLIFSFFSQTSSG